MESKCGGRTLKWSLPACADSSSAGRQWDGKEHMASGRKPGSEGIHRGPQQIDDGTLCRRESPRPGPIGITAASGQDWMSTWRGTISEWSSAADDWFGRAGKTASGHAKSALLTLVDWLPFKQASPISTALLKHYVERSGDPYTLENIPGEWQDWIVKATRGYPGRHRGLNPYNSGLYDLRNSLGHFDAEVKANKGGTKTYIISDIYSFGFRQNDRSQRGRHGFPLGDLSAWQVTALRHLLPEDEYANPGGFKERWEIKSVGKETILFIPQQFLAEQGTPFKVTGSFTR